MEVGRDVENAAVICLKNTKEAWDFESSVLERMASGKDDSSSAKSLANFMINNPAIFAPISMVLASGVNGAGGAISMIINKSSIEAETRRRVLGNILSLDGSSIFDLNWAQLLEVRHYVGWFVQEMRQRHKVTSSIDLSICESSEAESILGVVGKYEAIIRELDELLGGVSKGISLWEELAEKERKDLGVVAEEERLDYLRLIDGLGREIKNLELKKDAGLIGGKKYESAKQGLDGKLQEAKNSHKCKVLGCGNLKAPMASYCAKHRCKVPGCLNCVGVVEGMPVVFGSLLRAASTVVGNANTKHIMGNMESFCAEHGADLSKESSHIKNEIRPSESEWSAGVGDLPAKSWSFEKIATALVVVFVVIWVMWNY